MFSKHEDLKPNDSVPVGTYANRDVGFEWGRVSTAENNGFPSLTLFPLFEKAPADSPVGYQIRIYCDSDEKVYRVIELEQAFRKGHSPVAIERDDQGRYRLFNKVYRHDQLIMACRIGVFYDQLDGYVVVGNRFCAKFPMRKNPVYLTTVDGVRQFDTLEQASKEMGIASATISRMIASGRVCKRLKGIFSRSLETKSMKWYPIVSPDGKALKKYFISSDGYVRYPSQLIRKPGPRINVKGVSYNVAELFLNSIP